MSVPSLTSLTLNASAPSEDIVPTLVAYLAQCLQPTPPSMAGAVSFLQCLGVSQTEACVSLQDALSGALHTRVSALDLEGCVRLLGVLVPLAPLVVGSPLGELFSGLVQAVVRLCGGVGRGGALVGAVAPLGPILSTREGLANVTPELVLSLPPPCRHFVWKAAPCRCPGDLSHALLHFDRTATIAREQPLNLLISSRVGTPVVGTMMTAAALPTPPPPSTSGGAPTSPSAAASSAALSPPNTTVADVCRDARLKARRSPACALLFECVRNYPPAYATALALIQRRFEDTRDAKWCTLRSDLYCLHLGTSADLPKDPLDSVIVTAEHFLAGAPVGPLIDATRAFLAGEVGGGAGAAASAAAAAAAASAGGSSASANTAAASKHSDALKKAVSETLRMAREFKETYKTPPGVGIEYRDAHGKLKVLKGGSKREWGGQGFCTPVHTLLPPALAEEYAREVAFPMDLGTMNEKAKRGEYRGVEDVKGDMRLVVGNCRKFNERREAPDSARAMFALAERIGGCLDDNLRKFLGEIAHKEAAHTGVLTILTTPPLVMQLLMVLAEPTLTRALTQTCTSAIAASCAAGTFALDGDMLPPLLSLLSSGDLAFALPRGVQASSSSSSSSSASAAQAAAVPAALSAAPPISASAVGSSAKASSTAIDPTLIRGATFPPSVYPELIAGVKELLASATFSDPQRPPFPLTLALLVSTLQRLFVETELELDMDATQPTSSSYSSASSSSSAAASASAAAAASSAPPAAATLYPGLSKTNGALREVVEGLLRVSPLLHRRSMSLLAAGVSVSCRLNPSLPSHLDRLVSLASLGVHPRSGLIEPAVLVTLLQRVTAAVLSPPRRKVGGLGEEYLPPTTPALTLLHKLLVPAVHASSLHPPFRALFHDLLAEFLRFLLTKRAMESTDAVKLVHSALQSLALPPTSPCIQASLASWPSLPLLLSSSTLQPIALLWTRPDFHKARASYSRLVQRHFPGFEWAHHGLNPDALTFSNATVGSGGDLGSVGRVGDDGASEA